VGYEFLFMRADGGQLQEISSLVDAGIIRPVVGQVFPVDQTRQAVSAAGAGGGRGKVVVDNELPTIQAKGEESS
jgi:alcohol dehydrogenase